MKNKNLLKSMILPIGRAMKKARALLLLCTLLLMNAHAWATEYAASTFFQAVATASTASITANEASAGSGNYVTKDCSSSFTMTASGGAVTGYYSTSSGTTAKYYDYNSNNGGLKSKEANNIWIVFYSADEFVAGDSIVIANGNASTSGAYIIVGAAANNTGDYHSVSAVSSVSTTQPTKNTNYYYILPNNFTTSHYLAIRANSTTIYTGGLYAYHQAASCEELAAPTGLTCVDQSYNTLSFSWNAVANASSYDVFLYTDEECTVQKGGTANTSNTTCRIRDLDASTTYYCKVQTKGDGSTYCTSGGTTATAVSGTTDSGTRTFKSGEIIFFKEASGVLSNLPNLQGSGTGSYYWKASGGTIHAYFFNATESAWADCTDPVSGSWDNANAVYPITVPGSGKEYTTVIFTRAANRDVWDKGQTINLQAPEGKNMFCVANEKQDGKQKGSWSIYANGPAVVGDMNNWRTEGGQFVFSGDKGTVYMDLAANTEYKFKVLEGETWYGNAGVITSTVYSWWGFISGGSDCTIRTGEAGSYAFKWNNSSKTLGVYYPEARLTPLEYIYFDARDNSTWKAADFDARFWFKYYDSDGNYPDDKTYHDCTKANAKDSWVYPYVVPNSDYIGHVQVNRMVSGSQSGVANDLFARDRSSSKQNCIKLNSSDNSTSWTTYCPPMNVPTLSDNGTTTYAGNGTVGTPYIVKTGDDIKVQASSTTTLADPDMTAMFDFQDDGSTIQNTTATTCTFAASSTDGTAYVLTVDAYNTFNETNGTKATSTTTLYYTAKDIYNITYKCGTHSTGSDIVDHKIHGTSIDLRGNTTFSRTGYNLVGWSTSDGGDEKYDINEAYTSNDALTLYPVWEAKTTSIKLDDNDENHGASGDGTASVNYDATAVTSITHTTAADGYQRTGYWTAETGGYKVLNADGTFATYSSNISSYISSSNKWCNESANVTLYAQYEIKKYTVSFAASPAGYGSVSPTSISNVEHFSAVSIDDDELTLAETKVTATPTDAGADYTYAFTGWSVDNGDEITEATTITASFSRTANSYDVSFSLTNAAYSSGTNEGENVATYGTNYSVTFAATSGYSFPSDITVQIGGVTKTKDTHYSWNSSTGALTVYGSYILDDIVISFATIKNCTDPTSLTNGAIGSTTATVSWTAGGSEEAWEVYVNTSSSTPAVDATPTATPEEATYTFTSLAASTEYYWWVRAKCSASDKSDWVAGTSFTTDCAAPSAPSALGVTSYTHNTVTVSVTDANDANNYDFYWSTSSTAPTGGTTPSASNTSKTPTLTGLSASTTYHIWVRAKCSSTSYSSWIEAGSTFTTSAAPSEACWDPANDSDDKLEKGDTDLSTFEDKFDGISGITSVSIETKSTSTAGGCSGADEGTPSGYMKVKNASEHKIITIILTAAKNITIGGEKYGDNTGSFYLVKSTDTSTKLADCNTGKTAKATNCVAGTYYIYAKASSKSINFSKLCIEDACTALSTTPGTGSATVTGKTTATLPYTLTNTSNVASVTIKVYEGSTLRQTFAGQTATTSGTCSATGLSAGTTYTYTVTPIGDTGYCDGDESSKSSSFTTKYGVTYAPGVTLTSGDEPTDNNAYDSGDEVIVKDNTGNMVYSGYTFRGWTYNGTFYQAGDKLTMPSGNVTLTAVWDAESAGSATTYYFGSITITTGALTKGSTGGYKGFFTNTAGAIATTTALKVTKADGKTLPAEASVYYDSNDFTSTELQKSANWEPTSTDKRYMRGFKFKNGTDYKITLGSNVATSITFYGWCGDASKTLTIGGQEFTSNSTKQTFEYHEFTKSGNFSGNVSISQDGDFYGILVIACSGAGSSNYKVSFTDGSAMSAPADADRAIAIPSDIVGIPSGTKIVAPEAPAAYGYHFAGWYKEAACTNAWTFASDQVTTNTTLYAKWEDDTHYFIGGTEDHEKEWEEADNWESSSAPSNSKPFSQIYIMNDAVIADGTTAHVGRVDIVTDASNGKTTSSGHLKIESNGMLIIHDKVSVIADWDDKTTRTGTTSEDVYIGSEFGDVYSIHRKGGVNGALVQLGYDSDDPGNAATVQFACLSWFNTSAEGFDPEHPNFSLTDINQYIGIPFTGMKAKDYDTKDRDYVSSMLFEYDTWSSRWSPIWEEDDMYPFRGYDILWIRGEQPTFNLTGTLVACENQPIELRDYTSGYWEDYNENLLANSWTAPIDITKFETSDFHNAEATIYMFNAGTGAQFESVDFAYGKNEGPGQYSALPINLVKEDPSSYANFSTIPSMQSFSVITTGDDATITLDYKRLVYDGAVERGAIEAMHAPRRVAQAYDKPMEIKLGVQGLSGMGDMVRVLEREDFTDGFDNGWEASKLCGVAEAPSMYALTEVGMQSITAVSDVEGMVLAFRAGSLEDTYTFSFAYDNEDPIYLYDTQTNVYTRIQTGASYTFTTTDKNDHERFILTRSYVPSVITGVDGVKKSDDGVRKVLVNDHVYIIRGGKVYSIDGAVVK